jgi:carboxymethylenebutenolidase
MTYFADGSYPGVILWPDILGLRPSFHGGGLVTDASNSPHRLIPEMDALFLIAIADSPVYRGDQAELASCRMLDLFRRAL